MDNRTTSSRPKPHHPHDRLLRSNRILQLTKTGRAREITCRRQSNHRISGRRPGGRPARPRGPGRGFVRFRNARFHSGQTARIRSIAGRPGRGNDGVMSEEIPFDTHRFVKNLTASGFNEAQAEALANEQPHLHNMTESGRLLLADDLIEAIQAGCAVVRCVATTDGYGRGDGHDHESRHLDNNRRVRRARCVAARTVQRNKLTF